MGFLDSKQLVYLWLLIPIFLLLYLARKKRIKRLMLLGSQWTRLLMDGSKRGFLGRFKNLLFVVGCTAMLLAIARPYWGFVWQDVVSKGADIMIAVDLSQSMLSQDIKASRLERAKREVRDLLHLAQGDRIGLMGFAGTAFVQCPLTTDYAVLEEFLNYLRPERVPIQGTSFAAAIRTAIESFADQPDELSAGRAIVFLTDGEDHDQETSQAIEEAKKIGLKVFVMGIGTTEGGPIPLTDGGFKKDENGKMVISKLGVDALRSIAETGGGSFVMAANDDSDWDKLYFEGIAKKLDDAEIENGRRKLQVERSPWLVEFAMIVLVIQFLLRPWGQSTAAVLLAASVMFGNVSRAEEKEQKTDPTAEYNAAVEEYRKGNFEKASEGFAKSAQAEDQRLAEYSYFNLGNSEAMNGNLEGALEAYEEAVKINPGNQKAKENYSYVQAKLNEKQNPPSPSQAQDNEKSESGNQSNQNHQDQSQNQGQSEGQPNGAPPPANPDQNQQGNELGSPQNSEQNQDQHQQSKEQGKEGNQEDGQEQQQSESKPQESNEQEKEKEGNQGSEMNGAKDKESKNQNMSAEEAEKILRSAPDKSEKYLNRPLRGGSKEQKLEDKDSQGRQKKDW